MKHRIARIIILILLPIITFISVLLIYNSGKLSISFARTEIFKYNKNDSFISVLDVGEAQSILIYSKGITTLIDTGNDDGKAIELLHRYGIKTLDYIILSHYHDDHTGGLYEIVNSINTDTIIGSRRYQSDEFYDAYESVIDFSREQKVEFKTAYDGMSINVGDIVLDFYVFASEYKDENNKSIVLSISFEDNRVLITGDFDSRVEKDLIESNIDLSSDIFVLSHHGSKTSNSPDFIDYVGCDIAVASCGEYTKYFHPDKKVVNNIKACDVHLYSTNKNGVIRIDFKETIFSISVEKISSE